MPENCPPIVIVQHMPETFTAAFADRLDPTCPPRVKEAANGDLLSRGWAYVAPGNYHMFLRRGPRGVALVVEQSERVNRHRPSVDVLFNSIAPLCARKTIGIMLTGMGGDGSRGMLAMHQAGSMTIAQDEASCVVFGMPKEAIALGAVDYISPLSRITELAMKLVAGEVPRARASA